MFICKVFNGIHIHFNHCQTFKLNSILSYSIHSLKSLHLKYPSPTSNEMVKFKIQCRNIIRISLILIITSNLF